MIYLDHAATTPLDPRVLEKMMPYLTEKYGNPSSLYLLGQDAKTVIEEARVDVAHILSCEPSEIIFTGSGTESNNLAIFGIAQAYLNKGNHIIISAIEHHSILYAAKRLEQQGFDVTYLPVDQYGIIHPDTLGKALKKNTILVSIMYANNEIGTIQTIKELGELCQGNDIVFHTDACQAASCLPLNVNYLKCDSMSLNGGKIYGPKGVGVLYLKRSIELVPQLVGGNQENKRRAGTENVAAVIGMAHALALAQRERELTNLKLKKMRDFLLKKLSDDIPTMHLNGHPEKRLPNNINISIPGVEGESLILRLDMQGIAASTGAACTTASLEPSHVLSAIGLSKELTYGSLRVTTGKNNTMEEIEEVSRIIPKVVSELLSVASIWV